MSVWRMSCWFLRVLSFVLLLHSGRNLKLGAAPDVAFLVTGSVLLFLIQALELMFS